MAGILRYSVLLLLAAAHVSAAGEDSVRPWIGPDYWANRFQDWVSTGDRIECREGAKRFPLRTLHRLTAAIQPFNDQAGAVEMRVRLAPLGDELDVEAFRGFLIGAGGPGIDPRLTALVHHAPAEDGGILAVVDDRGVVSLRDNSQGAGDGGAWSLRGGLGLEAWPELEGAQREGEGSDERGPLELVLEIKPMWGRVGQNSLVLRAERGGELLSQAVKHGVEVIGGFGLVSHRGEGSSFEAWRVVGGAVKQRPEHAFGPIFGVQYTLSQGVLKLTAQVAPLSDRADGELPLEQRPTREVVGHLELAASSVTAEAQWQRVATARLEPLSSTLAFRVDDWDDSRDEVFRVLLKLPTALEPNGSERGGAAFDGNGHGVYEGLIRADPTRALPRYLRQHGDGSELVLGALTCKKDYTGGLRWNEQGLWHPHADVARAMELHDPDLLFFAGDQLYEGDLTPPDWRDERSLRLDYHYRWARFLMAFGGLTRTRPSIAIPDDHDVYHGNLWGAGGVKAEAREGVTAQDAGGYRMPAQLVNMVHTTQTSHLPDPVDPEPAEQGISVYFTELRYAGVSFAILGDRQWKSSATLSVPEGVVKNGFFRAEDFDPKQHADPPGAQLFGERQEAFLERWATDFSGGVWAKAALSQTLLADVVTLPSGTDTDGVTPGLALMKPGEYPPDDEPVADADSGGWPKSGRERALRLFRKGRAVHICGDQHLGAAVQYGIDAFRDAGFALGLPAVANTWPRRWFPRERGGNAAGGAPRYTGDYEDGFGNRVTVLAVANPMRWGVEPAALNDRSPGYGIVRFRRDAREVVLEAWPRFVDPAQAGARPYAGWPIVVPLEANDGRQPVAWLPRLELGETEQPIQVIDAQGEVVYALRAAGESFQPPVFADGEYTLLVGDGAQRQRIEVRSSPSREAAGSWKARQR